MSIQNNLQEIHDRISAACRKAGRNPSEVRLIAVSKVKPAALIDEAAAAGQRLFGESYVQEFLEKSQQVRHPVEWHFIGHLQSNKVKYIQEKGALIHSVARLSRAREIDRQWGKNDRTADILLQVNLGQEESKSGTSEQALVELARAASALPHLRVRGLMTLPPYHENPEDVRPYFRRLRELATEIDRLSLPNVSMQELSMGMSHDFEVAIDEGATLVRVGTAIFGEREYRS